MSVDIRRVIQDFVDVCGEWEFYSREIKELLRNKSKYSPRSKEYNNIQQKIAWRRKTLRKLETTAFTLYREIEKFVDEAVGKVLTKFGFKKFVDPTSNVNSYELKLSNCKLYLVLNVSNIYDEKLGVDNLLKVIRDVESKLRGFPITLKVLVPPKLESGDAEKLIRFGFKALSIHDITLGYIYEVNLRAKEEK